MERVEKSLLALFRFRLRFGEKQADLLCLDRPSGHRLECRLAGQRGDSDLRPGQLTRIRRVEYPDGCGDLVFEEFTTLGTDSDGARTTNTRRYGFMAIRRVHEVEELLRKALLSSGGKKEA